MKSSDTTTNRFRFSRTASIVVGNVSSHIVELLYVVSVYCIEHGGALETCLGVCDYQATRRANQCDQRCGEEHLHERNVTILGLMTFLKGFGVVDAKAG